MIRATAWTPLVAVAGGAVLAAAGIRPLFIESGGARLAGLGHPAFLAGVCLAALYACLIELLRHGRPRDLALLAANGVILVLTGARAPLAYGVAVVLLSLLCIRSSALPNRFRVWVILGAGITLPALIVLAGEFASVRLFNLLTGDVGNLSGREYLWPLFEQAAAGSPWFGWGVGAGNVVLPPDNPVAKMLHTWAAHNEYLRIQVEGGYFGFALLVVLFVAWVWRHTASLAYSDRMVMRLVFVALAGHAFTDNVLISTPACVLFALTAAVFSSRDSALPDSSPVA